MDILAIILILIFAIISLANTKVKIVNIVIDMFKVFTNNQSGKFSIFDLISFIISPLIISYLLVWNLNYVLNDELINVLISIFSIIFTILFGFSSILVEKLNNDNPLTQRVVKETLTTILMMIIISLISTCILIFTYSNKDELFFRIVTNIIIFFALNIMLYMFMTIKRIYIIFNPKNDKNNNQNNQ